MKRNSDLRIFYYPDIKKLIMKIFIAFLIVVVSVSSVFAVHPLETGFEIFVSETDFQQRTITG